jgi:hypothetical protein
VLPNSDQSGPGAPDDNFGGSLTPWRGGTNTQARPQTAKAAPYMTVSHDDGTDTITKGSMVRENSRKVVRDCITALPVGTLRYTANHSLCQRYKLPNVTPGTSSAQLGSTLCPR